MSLDPILQLSVALHLSICVPSIILSIKCYAITKHTLNFRVELSLGDQIETWGNRVVIRFIGNARFSSPFHHCFIMRFDSLADSRGASVNTFIIHQLSADLSGILFPKDRHMCVRVCSIRVSCQAAIWISPIQSFQTKAYKFLMGKRDYFSTLFSNDPKRPIYCKFTVFSKVG